MVEMLELANILSNFTGNSLIILDEIGRGTSTADGLSIAKAVLTYLHENDKGAPRTLFATHFHELIGIETDYPRIKNCHFAVKESGNEIIFKRKLVSGATDRSYGIHVAALAGIPEEVVLLAQENLENVLLQINQSKKTRKKSIQLLLFDSNEKEKRSNPLIEELISLNPDEMTPLGAITLLYSLRKKAVFWKEGEE